MQHIPSDELRTPPAQPEMQETSVTDSGRENGGSQARIQDFGQGEPAEF